jgi:hypothetical protein
MMPYLFAVVCGLLAEAPPLPETPRSAPPTARAEPGGGLSQGVVVILGDARITIAPGTKMRVEPVNTDRGSLLRVQVPGVTVEATEMRFQTEEGLYHLRVTPEGNLKIRTHPRKSP